MKKTKNLFPILLTLVMGASLAMPMFACGDGTDDTKKEGNVKTISASLLDGKVANLLSANGIAIQDKKQNEPTTSAPKTKKARNIVASAEETSTVEQPETELVKQTEEGVQDVHFHDGEKGDYRKWNEKHGKHHHDGKECEKEDCMEVSDEILEEEEEMPTVISLDARVNKLYNSGKFTFMCVSSAVEGQVQLLTQKSMAPMDISMRFFLENGAWLYTEEHYFSEQDRSIAISYINVQSGDKKGKILVRRSEVEEAYHYANYWSDDFNQSYIIDNETGKTYSLSSLPYIYSVQNGVIVTKTNTSETLYQPKIDESGELVLDEIKISDTLREKYKTNRYIADIHGNIVFTSNQVIQGADEYGEARENGFIFAGLNEQVYQKLTNEGRNNKYGKVKLYAYMQAKRYLIGNDGQIYRFDFRGETNSIPVHVLNAQGEWTDVPKTAHIKFSDKDSFFVNIVVRPERNWQFLLISQIKDGKTYFSNAAYGMELFSTRNTFPAEYAQMGYFVGISALPTDGSPDTAMQEFMECVRYECILDNDSIVYRVGDTAFAYEDKNKGELVIWDRETETQKTINCGEKIYDSDKIGCLFWINDRKYEFACFQANTANGTYYIGYEEKNPTKAWSEYATEPFEKEEKLDAYYLLMVDKLKS